MPGIGGAQERWAFNIRVVLPPGGLLKTAFPF
jgi:hypothetical protein